jgi:hypothetical protein
MSQADVERMKAAYGAAPRHRVRFRPGLQAQQGRLAGWQMGRHETGKDDEDDPRRGETGVAIDELKDIGRKLTKIPDDFNAHRTIKRFMNNRERMIETGEGIDWATAEALAFATLAQGRPSDPPVRSGLRARHVLAAPFGALRPERRKPLHPAEPCWRRPAALRGHQLDALRRSGARFRIRLLTCRTSR